MKRNLKIKAAVIIAVVLICLYGVIGIPKSGADIAKNFENNIKLGLDLKGGTQLVMQVQLQDAFKAVADGVIERMKDELRKANIEPGEITRNEPNRVEDADKIEVDIKGIPATRAGDFRRLVTDTFTDWNLNPVAGSSTDYRMTVKPTAALQIRHDTMQQTMLTIERKINGLGLAETSVQPTGRDENEAELLVQLPGVDDPARVKDILKTQAVLEWDEVKDGPFTSREDGLAKHGGVLPLNTKLVPSVSHGGPQEWWLVSRIPVVRGTDHPQRARQPGRNGPLGDRFCPESGCREPLPALYGSQYQ